MEISCTQNNLQIENTQEKVYKPLRKRTSDLINYRETRKRRGKGVWQHELAFIPISEVTQDPITFLSKLTRLEKRVLNLIIKHSIAYKNVFPSQAWLAEHADCDRATVNRIVAFLTDLQLIDKLNYNTLERVRKEEYMSCSYHLSGWFNNLSIRELLRPLFPALVIIPLMLLFSPDIAAMQYAQFKGLDAKQTGTLIKNNIYIYRNLERAEAPSGSADRISRYHEYNLFGELRGPIVSLYEAIDHFKKECLMNAPLPKRPLSPITERVYEKSPQQTNTRPVTEYAQGNALESNEEFGMEIDYNHEQPFPLEETMPYRPEYTPIPARLNDPDGPRFKAAPCTYPVDGGILARKEFYKRNPNHSEFQCADCKQRRRQ